ncbi:MAG: hypothetical protein F6K10_24805 [Moorea sp. SIO2B7]|nr:hypothetical protein [Moorena sp. SIO2B7]
MTLLDKVLENKDGEFKSKVLNLVFQCGLTPDAPVFLLMVSVSYLQVLLEPAFLTKSAITKHISLTGVGF